MFIHAKKAQATHTQIMPDVAEADVSPNSDQSSTKKMMC